MVRRSVDQMIVHNELGRYEMIGTERSILDEL